MIRIKGTYCSGKLIMININLRRLFFALVSHNVVIANNQEKDRDTDQIDECSELRISDHRCSVPLL